MERQNAGTSPASPSTVTVEEFSDILRISRLSAYRLVKSKKVAAIRVGRLWRIPEAEVQRFLTGGANATE